MNARGRGAGGPFHCLPTSGDPRMPGLCLHQARPKGEAEVKPWFSVVQEKNTYYCYLGVFTHTISARLPQLCEGTVPSGIHVYVLLEPWRTVTYTARMCSLLLSLSFHQSGGGGHRRPGALPLPPSALAQTEEAQRRLLLPGPSPSRPTAVQGAEGKSATQGPAPNLPETCKHETIIDERRLESHRF